MVLLLDRDEINRRATLYIGPCTDNVYIAILRLLVKLKRDLSRDLGEWPEAREKALERLLVYQAELEELLADEPTYGK